MILKRTNFLSLNKCDKTGYIYVSESWTDDRKVAVLPFMSGGKYLVRFEKIPCWDLNSLQLCSLTGSAEKGIDFKRAAVAEIQEETGYLVTAQDLIELGTARPSKFISSVYHLYGVCLDGKEHGEENPDDDLEAQAHWSWASANKLIESEDPLLALMFLRLVNVTRKG